MGMLLTTLGSYWLLIGVARAYTDEPYGSRYIYPAAVLIVVVVAEAAQGVALRNRVLAAVALVSCAATALNLAWLIRFGDIRRGEASVLAAELTALESARGQVPPDLQLDRERAPDIRAGPYFHAIDVLDSSPAPSQAQLARAPVRPREAADSALLRFTGPPVPYTPAVRRLLVKAGRPPAAHLRVSGPGAPLVRRRGACLQVKAPWGGMTALNLALPRLGLILQGDGRVVVRLRRFAPAFFGPGYRLSPADASVFVRPGVGRSTRPWLAQISGSGPYRLC
jgi:hypothetical protein